MSGIVRLIPKKLSTDEIALLEKLREVAKQAFSMRRKTLKNNLKGLLVDEDYLKLDLDPKCRSEQLSVRQFVKIAKYLS